VNIRCLNETDGHALQSLSEVLIDCVAGGASVSFMLVHRAARKRGVGAALLQQAEILARHAGKTLLTLDTASGDAERLYAKMGWQRCGVIPGYALLPNGGFCDTTVFYRTL
jgi:GNAT superfamily N-acetyltransferase